MEAEAKYKVFQMVKILKHRGLTYRDICHHEQYIHYPHNDINTHTPKKSTWQETTNVFAYYVVTAVIVFHWKSFLKWCQLNNSNIFQFKATTENISAFCEFIHQHHDTPQFLQAIANALRLLNHFEKTESHLKHQHRQPIQPIQKKKNMIARTIKKENKVTFLLTTARMSACELK